MAYYAPRTLAFLCELFHQPLQPDSGAIQQVHDRLYRTGEPPYSSFAVTPAGPVLSNPASRPGVVSQVAFLPDRFQFREELGALTAEGFGQRVRRLAEEVCESRNIPLFAGQQVTIRSLVNPRHFRDARQFLRSGMFGVSNELTSFGRDPQVLGIRLVFPPDGDIPFASALRIESYAPDPRSLYLESQSTFGRQQVSEGLESLEANVAETYEFLIDQALEYVSRFDHAQTEP